MMPDGELVEPVGSGSMMGSAADGIADEEVYE
jgi:hypothetical protein